MIINLYLVVVYHGVSNELPPQWIEVTKQLCNGCNFGRSCREMENQMLQHCCSYMGKAADCHASGRLLGLQRDVVAMNAHLAAGNWEKTNGLLHHMRVP